MASAYIKSRKELLKPKLYDHEIGICLLPSLLILLVFGGKPTINSLCMSAVFAYVVDLLGFLEGSIIMLIGVFGVVCATLIYSARYLLTESSFSMPFVFLVAYILGSTFFVAILQFPSLIEEIDSMILAFQAAIISALPLCSSCLMTWFICSQYDFLDSGFCFTSVYFAYLMYLNWPALPKPGNSISSADAKGDFNAPNVSTDIVPFRVLVWMFVLPVIVHPILHISLHHHILVSQSYIQSFGEVMISCLYPLLLMSFAIIFYCERYVDGKLHTKSQKALKSILSVGYITQAISWIGLAMSVSGNKILSDFRAISPYDDRLAGFMLASSAISLILSIIAHKKRFKTVFLDFVRDGLSHQISDAHIFVSISVVVFGVFLGVPKWYLWAPPCIISSYFVVGMFTSEVNNLFDHLGLLLSSILAGLCGVWILLGFASNTIYSLDVTFYSSILNSLGWGESLKLRTLCNICATCSFFAVVSAVSLIYKSLKAKSIPENAISKESIDSELLGFVPKSSSESNLESVVRKLIEFCNDDRLEALYGLTLAIFSILTAFAELIIREQDWSEFHATADDVYPGYVVVFTAGVIIFLSWKAVVSGVVRSSSFGMFIALITQIIKLFSLVSVGSVDCVRVIVLTASYIAPFYSVFFGSRSKDSKDMINSNRQLSEQGFGISKMGPFKSLLYLLISGYSTYSVYHSKTFVIFLQYMWQRECSKLQILCTALTCWFGFLVLFLFVYFRMWTFIRLVIGGCAAVALMLALDFSGPIGLSFDGNSLAFYQRNDFSDISSISPLILLIFNGIMAYIIGSSPQSHMNPMRLVVFIDCFLLFEHVIIRSPIVESGHESDSAEQSIAFLQHLFCFISAFGVAFIVHFGCTSAIKSSYYLSVVFLCCVWGLFSILFQLYAYFMDSYELLTHFVQGIVKISALAPTIIAVVLKVWEYLIDLTESPDSKSNAAVVQRENLSVNVFTGAVLGIINWGVVCLRVEHLSLELVLPVSSLLLALCKRQFLPGDKEPWEYSLIMSVTVWSFTALHALFLKGCGYLPEYLKFDSIPIDLDIFVERNVSICSGDYFMLVLHSVLLLLSWPVFVICFNRWWRTRKSSSVEKRQSGKEESYILLALISLLPTLASQIWSIRLLGLFGIVYGMHGYSTSGSGNFARAPM